MKYEEIEQELKTSKYDFLRENENLGDNIILLGIAGSHAYGTDIETSDIDIRGIAVRRRDKILGWGNFETYSDIGTDTTIWSLEHAVKLLMNCNPTALELLGLDRYFKKSEAGRELLRNKDMFLSKKAIYSYNGYALGLESEVKKNAATVRKNLEDMSEYTQSNVEKLCKVMMNCIRIYVTGTYLLSFEHIATYHAGYLPLLRQIRKGDYIGGDFQPTKEFYDLVEMRKRKFQEAVKECKLPDKPDYERIKDFITSTNYSVVTKGVMEVS